LTYRDTKLIKNTIIKSIIILSFSLVIAITLGIILGSLNNTKNIDTLLEVKKPALPSILYDRNGDVITTFYSDEKRELITLDAVPDYLVNALIVYEDESFFHHKGFNVLAILRAAINNALHRPVSGASTLTQQLARTLFLTHKFSWTRKIKELWIAIQLEKKFTKNEILTLYLNHVPLGYGTNGVEAAAKFYFNKDVGELSYAEAASIITLISNPTHYSFIRFPKNHKKKQLKVLDKMVKAGIITNLEAENSFNEFWIKWESTTHTSRGAFFNREDKAPFFSDWVMNELANELPTVDIFRDGLRIYSTLDLHWNKVVQDMLIETLDEQQKIFEDYQIKTYNIVQKQYLDTLALMSDVFSLTNVNFNYNRNVKLGLTDANKDIMPPLNLTAQILGLNLLDTSTEIMLNKEEQTKELLSQVQGACVAIDNETGQIIVMIGGKQFDPNNRFNYAMQSERQPGSAFKPFIYSAAFDTKIFTPASVVVDKPRQFIIGDDPDDWYEPYNYGANYYGVVNLRRALRRSMNIPACIVFNEIGKNNGYKVPIDRAALLLGINSQEEINRRFEPTISTALGTGSVSPIEMSTAFSIFANLGKKRIPNCIIKVEDNNGKVIYEPWKELQRYYRENDKKLQVISPQNAYIMTSILKDVVNNPDGTLCWIKQRLLDQGKEFPDVEFAAKTGTTQNWSDAWTISYSPSITATGWVGFDTYGLSLGYEQPGAKVVGPIILEFMRQYHMNMPKTVFKKPDGLAMVKVCKNSGLKPSKYCREEDLYYEYFLPGTVPTQECNYCKQSIVRDERNLEIFNEKLDSKFQDTDFDKFFDNDKINVDTSILKEFQSSDKDFKIDDNDVNFNFDEIDTDSFYEEKKETPTPMNNDDSNVNNNNNNDLTSDTQ